MAKKQFKAESRRLLNLMINSIYTNQEIFLREIISNASDALDKRYYLSLTGGADKVSRDDLKITIERHSDTRQLVIEDNGVGMTAEELEKNLGTIAKSGSAEFREQLEKANDNTDIIGQFGVGFYSAFMVAKRILVETHSVKEDQAHSWTSSGDDGYVISDIDKPEIGTRITLDLKDDTDDIHYGDYLEEYRIRELVKKYSDYVRYPIMMSVTKHIPDPTDENKTIDTEEVETLNSMIPLWKKKKSDIKEEEYNEFYKSKFNDWEDPQKVIHYSVEGNISYTALLYIPSRTPYNFYYTDYEQGIQLYSHNVFIMDKVKNLIPDYYRFVQGVIDCDDLSLNISREMLQQNRQVQMLAKSIEKKIHAALEDMLKNEREKYEKFFDNFGLNLKAGIFSSYGANNEKLQDFLMFRSSKEGKYVTLKEYTDRMGKDQKAIYYAVGRSIEDIERMPVMEKLRKKDIEVLYFLDERDEFVSGTINTYAEKPFQSVSKGDLDLDTEEEKKAREEKAEANKEMLEAIRSDLGDRVTEVRVSSRLGENDPVCLSAAEGVSLEMEKYLANDPSSNGKGPKASKILEINPDHPIFAKLQSVYQENPDQLKDYADVLFNQAMLIQGLPIEDPAAYARKIADLLVRN
ncbi:MAG: molecular chaperone HtpG [Bulleidia sp.]